MLFNFVAKHPTLTVITSGEFVVDRLLSGASAEAISRKVGTAVTRWLIREQALISTEKREYTTKSRFEVVRVELLKIWVFWDVATCHCVNNS